MLSCVLIINVTVGAMCTNIGSQSEEQSEDLMPCIMGIFDSILEEEKQQTISEQPTENFSHLSQGVQRLLSHLPQQKIRIRVSPEKKNHLKSSIGPSSNEKISSVLNKSNESLDIISPAVQKMLSNLPDTELVISSNQFNKKSNRSFLHSGSEANLNKNNDISCKCEGGNDIDSDDIKNSAVVKSDEDHKPIPLGSYLHTSPQGVASRIHIENKSPKKYSQTSTEGRLGISNKISSNEVSRPVSLSSIGSYSSLESSGNNQLGYSHLLSAESLDSDPEPSGSQGSADSGIAEQSSSLTAEMRVLQEILESETKYVSDLEEIIQGYLKPWRLESGCPLAPYLDGLFGNIEEIYEFNRKFLDFLNEAEGDSTKTANVFLQNHSGFAVYTEYCTNYPHTMNIISELTRNEELVPIFREKQMALGHPLPLATYLLKPVQRILKYHLLLQRLSKQCEPEQHVVDLALATMTGIASDINLMKRKHEHAVRVQEIQSQLYEWTGPDLTALGELIAEGTFRVAGARGRRHVLLFDKLFLMTKSKQNGILCYKFHIMCSNLMLVEQVRGDPLSFQVLPFDNPRLQCTLRARSPQHKREWTLQIKRVILENYSAIIPNHARKLVMQLGENVPEINESPEKWVPLKNSDNTPHYLERRSRIRKTMDWRRKSEPGNFLQYKSKTLPHKTSKLKKQKGASTFYTDLSDSETYGSTTESTNNLSENDKTSASSQDLAHSGDEPKMDLEQIVSDIVKEEFEKMKKTKRTSTNNENSQATSSSKSDSLPRSFQLNEQGTNGRYNNMDNINSSEIGSSNSNINVDSSEATSDSEISEHPYHKIYRRSLIRVSFLQRIKALMPEQQRKTNHQIWSQHNFKCTDENMEKTEPTDPLPSSPCKPSSNEEILDNSFSERDEVDEIHDNLQKLKISNDTGQNAELKSFSSQSIKTNSSLNSDSSQYDDSNNENLLDNNNDSLLGCVIDEYYPKIDIQNNSIESCLSSSESNNITSTIKYFESTGIESKTCERNSVTDNVNKIAPPIPVKPSHLSIRSNRKSNNGETTNTKNEQPSDQEKDSCDNDTQSEYLREFTTKSWVKAMIGRFE